MFMSEPNNTQQGNQRQNDDDAQVADCADRAMLLGNQRFNDNIQVDMPNSDHGSHLEDESCSIVMDNDMIVDPNVLEMKLLLQVTDRRRSTVVQT